MNLTSTRWVQPHQSSWLFQILKFFPDCKAQLHSCILFLNYVQVMHDVLCHLLFAGCVVRLKVPLGRRSPCTLTSVYKSIFKHCISRASSSSHWQLEISTTDSSALQQMSASVFSHALCIFFERAIQRLRTPE